MEELSQSIDCKPQKSESVARPARPSPPVRRRTEAEGLPFLQRYLDEMGLGPSGVQQRQEAARYYGGASGSKSAIHTTDGHLTKFGAKQVCVVCLKEGEHKAWECPETRCFVCYNTGHGVKSCPWILARCERCGRRGHTAEGCLRDVLRDASYRINWNWLRCIRCGELGHPVCGAIKDPWSMPEPRRLHKDAGKRHQSERRGSSNRATDRRSQTRASGHSAQWKEPRSSKRHMKHSDAKPPLRKGSRSSVVSNGAKPSKVKKALAFSKHFR